MKNKKIINEEIRLIKSLMSYDTSKTLTEQSFSSGMNWSWSQLSTDKVLTQQECDRYKDNFVDGLDGWVTVAALKDVIYLAEMLHGKFYKDTGNLKRMIENGNVADAKNVSIVEEDGYYYYPAMAEVMYLYQVDESGDTIIGDINDIGVMMWTTLEAENKVVATVAVEKGLEGEWKTQAQINKEKEEEERRKEEEKQKQLDEGRDKLFRDFPCFRDSLSKGLIEYVDIYLNSGTNKGVYIKYISDGNSYLIFNSGNIYEDTKLMKKVGKINCSSNTNLNEQFVIVDDSGNVVDTVDDNTQSDDSTQNDDNTQSNDNTQSDNNTQSDDNTQSNDNTQSDDCDSIEITDDIKKVVKMIQEKNAILMKGSHAQESKVPGIKATIEVVQCKVGAKRDGLFGNETKTKVEKFQKDNGLKDDGIVGQNTINKMIELNLITV